MCPECQIARENHSYTLFNPKCIYCGARILQKLREVNRPAAEIKKRQTAMLEDWAKFGHNTDDIKRLAKGPLCLEGQAEAENDPLKKRRKSSNAQRKAGV